MSLAFEITTEDIDSALPEKQFSPSTLSFLISIIELKKVEKAALYADELDAQTDFAMAEIKQQLNAFFSQFPEEISVGLSQESESILFLETFMNKLNYRDLMDDILTTGYDLKKEAPVDFIVFAHAIFNEFGEELKLFEGHLNMIDETITITFDEAKRNVA